MGINRNMPKLKVATKKVRDEVLIGFSFAPNGGSNPVAASNDGFVSSVVRSAQGKFLATLPSGIPKVIAALPEIWFNGAGTLDARIGQVNASAGTVEIYLVDNTNTAQDLALAATTRVSVMLLVENQVAS